VTSTAAGGEQSLLSARAISHTFGNAELRVDALRDVSFAVQRGEMLAIVGPSGSGKSTLLHVVSGIERVQAGQVILDGCDIVKLSDAQLHQLRRRRVGLVFQNFNLLGTLTAAENVALPLELDGVRRRTALQASLALMESLQIADLAGRFPDQMSGGQQQRVAIGRALIGGANLVLADEPTGALDSETGQLVMATLSSIRESGGGVIVVTHDIELAHRCDRVLELRDGRLRDGS
jgi:putative ABC transport system ATP-binding protein